MVNFISILFILNIWFSEDRLRKRALYNLLLVLIDLSNPWVIQGLVNSLDFLFDIKEKGKHKL